MSRKDIFSTQVFNLIGAPLVVERTDSTDFPEPPSSLKNRRDECQANDADCCSNGAACRP
jgi:hypothetical protein